MRLASRTIMKVPVEAERQAPLPRVVHIVPYDAVGGVEAAAASCPGGRYPGFSFGRLYLVSRGTQPPAESVEHGPGLSESDPRAYAIALKTLWKVRPRLLIASLWRSCVVLLGYKLLQPGIQAVTFLHSACDVHWLDKALNRLAMRWSAEVWTDSLATLEARVPAALRHRARVISMMIDRQPEPDWKSPEPTFIFWGRLSREKDLSRALRLFAQFHGRFPAAVFHLVGPDAGDRESLSREAVRLGVASRIVFHGPMDQPRIFQLARTCSFYLQTSRREGMAMSVLEAMQLGLVPVVTPVGEITRYCRDGENGILIGDDAVTVERVGRLLADHQQYRMMANRAWSTWQDQSLYREDVIAGCTRLLEARQADQS
jgi:glycosyltransferase involved in cell wall biosynthesis